MAARRAAVLASACVALSAADCGDSASQYGECCGTANPYGPQPTITNGSAPLNVKLLCMAEKCAVAAAECYADDECRRMLMCEKSCNSCTDPTKCDPVLPIEQVPSCAFMCSMYYGAGANRTGNAAATKMSQCMLTSGCVEGKMYPPCGKCHIVPERDGVKNFTSMEQIAGRWWVVGGLNYVYDSYPCDMCRWEKWDTQKWNPTKQTGYVNRVTWSNAAVYQPLQDQCGGAFTDCVDGLVQVEAMPTTSVVYPGVLFTNYTTPLTAFRPQLENWTIVAFPHPDWMFVQWCGENFALDYAGAIVLARHPNVDQSTMPGYVRDSFRAVAKGIDFDKDIFEVKNGDCPYQP